MNHTALKQYQSVSVESGIAHANPHQLVKMLLSGAMDRVATARGANQRGEIALRGESLSKAILIVSALRDQLNYERGDDIAQNLSALYDYIEHVLLSANLSGDDDKLKEAAALLGEIKAGWAGIPVELHQGQAHAEQ